MTQEPRILLADDDRLVLATLGRGLRNAGYDVLEAASGEEALELCAQQVPDLAILDIRMPGLSGIETARELCERYGIPFIILSAYGESDLVNDAVRQGALGYLVKPLDVTQVLPTIEAALKRAGEFRHLHATEEQLNQALSAGRETSTAVGLLMERHRLSASEAFETLRRFARSQRRKLADVAGELVQAVEAVNEPRPEVLRSPKKRGGGERQQKD